jgi:hypothetical protein
VPASDYRTALKELAVTDSGRFELLVFKKMDADDSQLAAFPRMHGSWRLSTSDATATTQLPYSEGQGPVELQYRLVHGDPFFRVGSEGSVFGKDCWAKIDTSAPELAGSPMAGQRFGLPEALRLFDDYRPKDSPAAGTAPLDEVLGAVGFQKVKDANPELFRQSRVPIEVQLESGRLNRILIFPQDLIHALDSLPGELPILANNLESLLNQTPPLFWGLQYSDYGAPIVIKAPPANRLLDMSDNNARCQRS